MKKTIQMQLINKVLLMITLSLYIGACDNVSDNQRTKETAQTKHDSIKEISKTQFFSDSEFEIFYAKFISDSVFQRKHLVFPLEGGVFECDTTIVHSEDNWIFFTGDIRIYNHELDSIELHQNVNEYELILIRKEIGTIYDIIFKKRQDSWYLTYCLINAC
jgi:hypothetical protein